MAQRLLGPILILLCWALADHAAAKPNMRLALLIGNQSYSEAVGPLKNPHNDVKLLADALSEAGFDVKIVSDGTYRQMDLALKRHARRVAEAGPGALSFLYYSGHGLGNPRNGRNYLVPVDAKSAGTASLWDESIDQKELIDRLKSAAPQATHFVVFDACRNELRLKDAETKSLASSKGFIPAISRAGMLIAHATAEGETASDAGEAAGVYASALAAELRKPNIESRIVFQLAHLRVRKLSKPSQDPWMSASSFPEVYFRESKSTPSIASNVNRDRPTDDITEIILEPVTPSGKPVDKRRFALLSGGAKFTIRTAVFTIDTELHLIDGALRLSEGLPSDASLKSAFRLILPSTLAGARAQTIASDDRRITVRITLDSETHHFAQANRYGTCPTELVAFDANSREATANAANLATHAIVVSVSRAELFTSHELSGRVALRVDKGSAALAYQSTENAFFVNFVNTPICGWLRKDQAAILEGALRVGQLPGGGDTGRADQVAEFIARSSTDGRANSKIVAFRTPVENAADAFTAKALELNGSLRLHAFDLRSGRQSRACSTWKSSDCFFLAASANDQLGSKFPVGTRFLGWIRSTDVQLAQEMK